MCGMHAYTYTHSPHPHPTHPPISWMSIKTHSCSHRLFVQQLHCWYSISSWLCFSGCLSKDFIFILWWQKSSRQTEENWNTITASLAGVSKLTVNSFRKGNTWKKLKIRWKYSNHWSIHCSNHNPFSLSLHFHSSMVTSSHWFSEFDIPKLD